MFVSCKIPGLYTIIIKKLNYLCCLDLDSGTTILQHEMPMISFASGGDSDTINFIAYVAKDQLGGRLVYSG